MDGFIPAKSLMFTLPDGKYRFLNETDGSTTESFYLEEFQPEQDIAGLTLKVIPEMTFRFKIPASASGEPVNARVRCVVVNEGSIQEDSVVDLNSQNPQVWKSFAAGQFFFWANSIPAGMVSPIFSVNPAEDRQLEH